MTANLNRLGTGLCAQHAPQLLTPQIDAGRGLLLF